MPESAPNGHFEGDLKLNPCARTLNSDCSVVTALICGWNNNSGQGKPSKPETGWTYVNTNCIKKEQFCQPNFHLVQACSEPCNFKIQTSSPATTTLEHEVGGCWLQSAVFNSIKTDRLWYRPTEWPNKSEQICHCGEQVRCHLRTQTLINCSMCVCVCVPLWIGRQGGFHGVEGVHRVNGGIIRVPPTVLERQPWEGIKILT